MVAIPELLDFLCPLCGSNQAQVTYMTGRGGRLVYLPLFSCAGCSVVFQDIQRFKRLMQHIRSVTPMGNATCEEKALVEGFPPLPPKWKPPWE